MESITARATVTAGLSATSRGQGLTIAVSSTGRVGSDGSLTVTGGGDIDIRIAGALNPLITSQDSYDKAALAGSIVNLCGATLLEAASIGTVKAIYGGVANPLDPRGADPFDITNARSFGGLVLVPGDSAFYFRTLGDMVIAGAGDGTRSRSFNSSAFTLNGTSYSNGGNSWFTLCTDHTAINLISAGGDMAPSKAGDSYNGSGYSSDATVNGRPGLRSCASRRSAAGEMRGGHRSTIALANWEMGHHDDREHDVGNGGRDNLACEWGPDADLGGKCPARAVGSFG